MVKCLKECFCSVTLFPKYLGTSVRGQAAGIMRLILCDKASCIWLKTGLYIWEVKRVDGGVDISEMKTKNPNMWFDDKPLPFHMEQGHGGTCRQDPDFS